jgi:hypothetical protein
MVTEGTGDESRSYEQHLADIRELVANGAGRWATEKDENDGERIKPEDLKFSNGFLEKHFAKIRG